MSGMGIGSWTTLVSVPALAAALDDAGLRVLDARAVSAVATASDAAALRLLDARAVLSDASAGAAAFAASHLPGAMHADLDRDLSDHSRPAGEGRHPLPGAAAFASRLGQWGIGPRHQVVVYDAGDGSMAAARAWWLLRMLGHEAVAVLDGGPAAWRASGLPETADVQAPPPLPPYPVAEFRRDRIVEAAEVVARLGDAPGWLLDARGGERFRGEVEPIDPVAGHIPGALNRPFAQNVEAGRFRDPDALRAELQPMLHGRDPSEVVLSCGSGVTACHLLLAMEHAGLPGARVYAGSWSGWIADPSRPVATGAT